ncbi:aminoglycoside phosphotransferase (APT) family kinase protein [Kineococcus xinjiangensis]|uniref:Aminoglycoside phosphotransferase (APT) family kinase protein n=1 Tax=Kineococcus xinjiangensis TaxID=512762 RepID=A0A2S6IWN7_9ACTN|nr:phosphotransferase [Kineococcus xinjiangensis]PPK98758.1 aminoglycoside phosphotransferase (APT) family kinase protein [Kineococcus xinjiangensis]
MPHRSPLALAALATAAVRGLDVVAAGPGDGDGGDYAVAVVVDAERREWVVRAPARPAAGAALDTELQLLRRLAGRLPFAVPVQEGAVELPEGGQCLVHRKLPGAALHPEDVQPGPGLAAALGGAIAAVHRLDPQVLAEAGAPVYESEEYRLRRLSELDRAAATGHVPPRLLTRWEVLMEDVPRWRFAPLPVHGDLMGEHVLAEGTRVVGMQGWTEAKVADPADDFAWLAVGADADALESVLEAYAHARGEAPDPHLLHRARLAGELALARWLLLGVRLDDEEIVEDARRMLLDLDEHADAVPLAP